jgi:hypothetical protein
LGARLVAALVAGEAWALLQTGERTIAHRDPHQAPLRDATEWRSTALERVNAAEAALGDIARPVVEIGAALSALFSSVRRYRRGRGQLR